MATFKRGQRVEVINGAGVPNEYARIIRHDKALSERTNNDWYCVKFEQNENGNGLCISAGSLRAA